MKANEGVRNTANVLVQKLQNDSSYEVEQMVSIDGVSPSEDNRLNFSVQPQRNVFS